MNTMFERGVAILSLDTEQIWGHAGILTEDQFERLYPNTPEVHDKLLDSFCSAEITATWFVVGGMTLASSEGGNDPRMSNLPEAWKQHVPAGDAVSHPLW